MTPPRPDDPLADVQAAVDHFLDRAFDCCERCGAARRRLIALGLDACGRPLLGEIGGCEHQCR